LAENTVKLYKLAVKQFDAFCTKYKLSPSWPPPLNHVVNFVAYLSCKGYSFSTGSSYVSGIAFQLKINGFNDVTDSFLIRKMLKGFHKARPTRDTRAPVTIDMLKLLPRALDAVCSSKYESLLFSTICSVAFFGFLRIGEVAVVSNKDNTSKVMQLSDVQLTKTDSKINTRFSKTDQSGKSAQIEITKSPYQQICPITLLKTYLSVRPVGNGPLFCHFNRTPVTKYQVSSLLRSSLQFLGINHTCFKGHSFRIGAATHASMQNVPDNVIQEMGRWSKSSYVFTRYIRTNAL